MHITFFMAFLSKNFCIIVTLNFFFLQYGDKRFQVTSNPENGIFLPSPFTEHLSHKLSLKQNSSVDERPFFSRPAGSSSLPTLHRGAFCQFLFRWIYYCHSSKFTGKKTGRTHPCDLQRFYSVTVLMF